jgi:hypothetical protein
VDLQVRLVEVYRLGGRTGGNYLLFFVLLASCSWLNRRSFITCFAQLLKTTDSQVYWKYVALANWVLIPSFMVLGNESCGGTYA